MILGEIWITLTQINQVETADQIITSGLLFNCYSLTIIKQLIVKAVVSQDLF